jgi:hypothetical protein
MQRGQPRRPYNGDGTGRFRRHFGRDIAKQRPRKRILPRADDDVIDMIGSGKFQDRRRTTCLGASVLAGPERHYG